MTTLLRLLLLFALFGAIAFWLRRSGRGDGSTRRPARAARLAEALALLIVGAVIVAIGGTDAANNGMLSRLDELPQALARAYVLLVAVTGLLILTGVAAAWKGMTRLGIVVVAVALSTFGLMINGPGRPINVFASAENPVTVDFTLGVSGVNIPHGVRLWVNDVDLGEAPIQMTLDEFLDSVPAWPEEDEESLLFWVDDYGLGGGSSGLRRPIPFQVLAPKEYRRAAEIAPKYYARVEYAGEQGLGTGQGGSGSGGSGHHFQSRADIEVIFPARTRRLRSLVNQARLQNYHVGPEWFEALETYDADAWLELRQLAQSNKTMDLRYRTQLDSWRPEEPEFLDVLQAWAAFHYNLDDVHDSGSAWAAFERIMAEADATGIYLTPSVAGAAVERLASELPAERLVDRALSYLKDYRNYSYARWDAFGSPQFGVVARPSGATVQPQAALHAYGGQDSGDDRFPPSTAALAHALWLQDKHYIQPTGAHNPIERELAPALLRRAYGGGVGQHPYLAMASEIGGPIVEQYLLRHDWQSEATFTDFRIRYHLHGAWLNKWLYFLSQLDAPDAWHARRNRPEVFLDLAAEITQATATGGDSVQYLDFLFQDLSAGRDDLARKFWPQFRSVVLSNTYRGAPQLFEYLVRMEPLSEVEMYAESWRRCLEGNPGLFVEHFLPLQKLPEEKRREVFEALLHTADLVRATNEFAGGLADAERHLRQGMFPVEYMIEQVLDTLREGDETGRERVRGWLAHGNPAHPVVEILARAPEPEIRALSLEAIRACPNPEHQALLAALLNDSDRAVRTRAEAIQAELKELAGTPPMTFASAATTFVEEK